MVVKSFPTLLMHYMRHGVQNKPNFKWKEVTFKIAIKVLIEQGYRTRIDHGHLVFL